MAQLIVILDQGITIGRSAEGNGWLLLERWSDSTPLDIRPGFHHDTLAR
jgi:hypothetical protein